MKVVALISGGKDSCFNMMHCVAQGHEIVALANLKPKEKIDELDSYMFQTVGHDVIDYYAEAMGLPLYRRTIQGQSLNIDSTYKIQQGDEVEDLYELLKTVQKEITFDAVSSGAILSNYQRERVENVCQRLGLQSLAYLWERDQEGLLNEMIESGLVAILIKTASLGLVPQKHLGKTLNEMQPQLLEMNDKYALNVCGEGGEYETLTLDCPLFLKRIVVEKSELVMHSDDAFAQVGYLVFKEISLQDKNIDLSLSSSDRLGKLALPSLPYFSQPVEIKETTDCLLKNTDSIAQSSSVNSHEDIKEMSILSVGEKAWIGDIICHKHDNTSLQDSVKDTLESLQACLLKNSFKFTDISLVHLFVSDMSEFSKINSVYKQYFNLQPASRVCVEAELSESIIFKMDVLIDVRNKSKDVLHVQSISYWAPANIGPYSQCVHAADTIYLSGSIGMVPSKLTVVLSDFIQESYLALYHVKTVLNAKLHQVTYESIGHGTITCYIISKENFNTVEQFFDTQTLFSSQHYLLQIICVPHLPRNANVEWHVQSTDKSYNKCKINNEYDSDDDDVDDNFIPQNFSVALSNTAIDSKNSLFDHIKDAVSDKIFYCCFLRIYYVVESVNEKVLRDAIEELRCKEKSVLSFVPVTALKNGQVVLMQGHCWKE